MKATAGAITEERSPAASSRVVVVGLLPVALLGLLVLANAGTLVEPSQMPDLIFEKLELYRQANVFAAHLTVKNQGTAQASGVELQVFMRGFQAMSQEHIPGRPGNMIADYDPSTREGSCLISSSWELDPGDAETFSFDVVPVLMEPDPPAPSFGHRVHLAYQGPLIDTRYEKQTDLALLKTSAAAGGEPVAPIAAAHAAAVRECDYLVVTHPQRLFSIPANTAAAVNTLLSDMAGFASTRYAALGYLDHTGANTIRDALRELIKPGGSSGLPAVHLSGSESWAQQMHPAFVEPLQGYLLIVGEVEVIPSWRETGWDLHWPNWNCTTHEVHLTDLPYARPDDDAAPSLIVGRIIGNRAADLSRALAASDGFDRSHALLVSGFDFKDEYEDLFVDFVDDAEDLIDSEYSVTKLHWSETPLGKVADFRDGSADRDLIVYQGHGRPDRWAGLDGTDFAGDARTAEPTPPITFGSEHPIVLGWACLTGSYEDHEADAPCGASDIGDYGIVEAFFDHGAAVYIGATEVASIPHNVVGAKALFDLWEPDKSIGYALTAVKRDMLRRHPGDPYWRFWVTEYNLYGDPKYGATQTIRPSLIP